MLRASYMRGSSLTLAKMKAFLSLLAVALCSAALANTIVVSPMKVLPKEVRSFSNDLYADVVADKELIQRFLKLGKSKLRLSDEELAYDEANSISSPQETHADGSESIRFLLHGCNGVFTDKRGTIYFWRLSSPRILTLTSQNREQTFLILKDEYLEFLHGYTKKG
jgi:hypothetical protein